MIQARLNNEQWQGNGRWRHFLVDSDSDLCLLPGDFCKGAQLSKSRIPYITAANGTKIPLKGEVRLEMRILGPPEDSSPTEMFIVNFLVSDTLTEGLLGIDFLQQYGALWNFSTGRLEVGHKEYKPTSALRYEACRVVASRSLEIPACSEAIIPGLLRASSSRQLHGQLMTDATIIKEGVAVAGALLPLRCEDLPVRILNLVDRPYKVKAGGLLATVSSVYETADTPISIALPAGTPSVDNKTDQPKQDNTQYATDLVDEAHESLTLPDRERLLKLLVEYRDVFSLSEFDLGRAKGVCHEIDTGDARPIRQPLWPQPRVKQGEIDRQVHEMLQHSVIEPAQSPWASNIVVVSKKDGTSRVCIDYRQLNADSYPLT